MNRLVWMVAVLTLFTIVSGADAALRDGTNFAIRPDTLKCASIEVPDDFGPVGAPTTFEIKSNCLEWCDFTSATVFTDPGNPTSIPVCFNTFNKEVNQTKQIKFSIQARSKEKAFNYGICVANQQDQDSGSGNPCNVVNSNQKYFEIRMEPITYVQDGEAEYEIQVYSPLSLELDVTVEQTGKVFSLTTKPQEKIVLRDKIKGITKDTILDVKAVVKGCGLPSCTKTASTLVSAQKPIPASGNFSATLMPEAATTKKGLPAKYYLEIRNYGDEKDYTIQLSLPQGLKSSFNSTTKTISNRENILIEITPERTECLYTFSILVKGQASKTLQGSLAVDELDCDFQRTKKTEALDSSKLSKINEAIIKAKSSSLKDDIGIFTDFTVKSVNESAAVITQPDAKKPKPSTGGGLDITTIGLVIAVIVIGLVFILVKKGKKVSEGEDWEKEGRY